ncbi:hypothetical protein [Paenibacillus sp. PL91]|uniref:hypothetical protein n=1 Tax=Paenibacillus sp. PL91 TaxID=2729538 RepID=UPI0016599848|nr:hypothetical protein [Paenibacillus sp. PL91]MBC9199789.1 hypothetical protein [Paenibacillus sp. PL91]
MKDNEIRTDADLQNCIYFQQKIEVWVGGEFEEVCVVADYDDDAVEVVGGLYYLRCNVMLRGA